MSILSGFNHCKKSLRTPRSRKRLKLLITVVYLVCASDRANGRAGSATSAISPFFLPVPACRPPANSIFPTDREPGTGYRLFVSQTLKFWACFFLFFFFPLKNSVQSETRRHFILGINLLQSSHRLEISPRARLIVPLTIFTTSPTEWEFKLANLTAIFQANVRQVGI